VAITDSAVVSFPSDCENALATKKKPSAKREVRMLSLEEISGLNAEENGSNANTQKRRSLSREEHRGHPALIAYR
jgi:hypothetical protein